MWRFLLTGTLLFINQVLFIMGLNLSTATYAAIWQVRALPVCCSSAQ